PVTTVGSYTGNETAVTIPITAINFNSIGSCNLKLVYDASVALATDVTSGPLLGGQLATNLSEPGIITLGWYTYPGLTLPDNTGIFNIEFSQVTSGYTDIIWDDDGYSCAWSDDEFNYLNDLPTSTYYINGSLNFQLDIAPHTIAPNITTCNDSVIDIPVRITGFSNIGAVSLTLHYDASSISFQSFTNNSGFPGLIVNESSPGVITTAGFTASPDGFSLADSAVFFTIHCNTSGNSTELNWYDDGISCEYAGPAPSYTVLDDTPQNSFYFDGSFTKLEIPGPAGIIAGPASGEVCQGQSGVIFSVDPIINATNYEWTLPDGAMITNGANTNSITVGFNGNAISGNVTVYGFNECGNGDISPAFPLVLNSPPAIIDQPASPDTVYAGAGIATFTVVADGSDLEYQWQEYMTNDWININNGGVYSGTNTTTLIITEPPVTMNGFKYRCVVSGICEPPAISDGLATLTVVTITGFDIRDLKIDVANNVLRFNSYPNPFYNETIFNYYLPDMSYVQIEVLNSLGEKIFTSINYNEKEGCHKLKFASNKLQPGFYTAMIMVKTKNNLMSSSIKIICTN
ncbi:MAG: hypothetical protein K8R74_14290, partial [Bacteroidales bacterium]|nr:hypothetical protein [Bacteroidales bacterium]